MKKETWTYEDQVNLIGDVRLELRVLANIVEERNDFLKFLQKELKDMKEPKKAVKKK